MSDWRLDAVVSHVDGFTLGPVDLELAAGRAVAIVGRSGAGKTTLLRSIAGLLSLDRGAVYRDGTAVTALATERRRIGYVPQGLGLFPHRSVAGNVAYAYERRGSRGARDDLHHLLDRFGLAALAGRRPDTLSGGERQRVALARALASEPTLILSDEPLTALDAEARAELAALLRTVHRTERIPLAVVTHDPEVAFALADRIVLLDAGRPAFVGATEELGHGRLTGFLARFIGFENVFERSELEAAAPSAFGGWLLERSGPGGVAIGVGSVLLVDGGAETFSGRVERVVPRPEGLDVHVDAEPFEVVGRASYSVPGRPAPKVGEAVRFVVEPGGVRGLDPPRRDGR